MLSFSRTRMSRPASAWVVVISLAAASLLPSTALASDGTLEINQTCAVQTGCFPGDDAGFPVTITTTGSYRLTSNLVIPTTAADGIAVAAPSVSIDLGGFEISGPVSCINTPPVCTPSTGTGSGIEWVPPLAIGTSVQGGTIRGMGSVGINLGSQAEVSRVRVRSNRSTGIVVGTGSIVSQALVHRNGSDGIIAAASSTVTGCTALENRLIGIVMNGEGLVSDNTVRRNGFGGIRAGTFSVVSGNSISGNTGPGINAEVGTSVQNNTSSDNTGDGISTSNYSGVFRNVVRSNGNYGLNLGFGSSYRENVMTSNSAGSVAGSPIVNLGNNNCDGSTLCP